VSLRVRLFLLLGGLVAALVVAEWCLVRALSRDLSGELGQVAFSVGESLVTSFASGAPDAPPTDAPHEPRLESGVLTRRWVFRTDKPGVDGSQVVEERAYRIERVDGKVRVIDELPVDGAALARPMDPHVFALHAGQLDLAAEGAHPEPGTTEEHDDVVVHLSLDASKEARFLMLQGPTVHERIPIPQGGLVQALDTFQGRLLAGSSIVLGIGLLLAAVVAHRATAPLRELGRAARAVGEGALGTQVPPRGGGEVGEAVASFNRMSRRLAELDEDARQLRAREHLSELGEVARGLAHGLRNPMNALGLSIEELARPEGPRGTDAATLAESARRQIRRMDQSIRSFLALSASGQAGAESDMDLALVVEDVVLETLQDCRGRVGIDIETSDEVPKVRGVAAALRTAVQALVVNAVEASPDGARVTVTVSACGADGAQVEVDDDGPGLSPEVRERLFTPHVTTKPTGAGMGLFLAQRIASTRHRGGVELRDRLGEDGRPRGTAAVLTVYPSDARRHG